MTETYKPEWAPAKNDQQFACRVMNGVTGGHDGMSEKQSSPVKPSSRVFKRHQLTVNDYVEGILSGNRVLLSRAITLIESNAAKHFDLAQAVLQKLLPYTGRAQRIGITGVPGAGKSTFIEALGTKLCQSGHKVAVLAVDPSSTVTRGSILGDKTRMERLAREPHSFIRPSPAGGTLGGVARKTRESLIICEAAGFDVILIETVGVGQSEVTVRTMVDFMLLLLLAGAGDELQGIKKGVIELADALVINKADGDNCARAQAAQQEYAHALHYLPSFTAGWTTQAYTCSALTGDGIAALWQVMQEFAAQTTASGVFAARRQTQRRAWLHNLVEEALRNRLYEHPAVKQHLPRIEREVMQGNTLVTSAVAEVLHLFDS